MIRLFALSLLVASSVHAANPNAEVAKIFTDKGSTYIRSDNKKVLVIGAELTAVATAESNLSIGKAVVMEVNGALARVSLDEDATQNHAKYLLVPKAKAAAAVPAPGTAPAASPAATPAPTGAPPAEARKVLPKLEGTLESGALRVSIVNDSDASWTDCQLAYSDGRTYKVGEVMKHSDDTVMKIKFTGPPEPLYDHLVVNCSEGESTFFFAKPQAPVGKLKGYATDDGKGSVVIYNNNDTGWTTCDVKKPNGTHYVLGNLKGHDHDSIDRGRFKKEAEPAKDQWLELRCKEGELHTKLD